MKTGVLILGGGVSAWAAAAEAVKAGVQVDLFCDGAGASPLIHGFCLPEGLGDSAELFYEDTDRAGCGQGDPAIIRTLTEGAEELDGYLAGLGLQPDREEGALRLLQPLGSRVPRVASVENADIILVMNNGSIEAKGTHEELLKSSEIYREIYESQTMGGDQ